MRPAGVQFMTRRTGILFVLLLASWALSACGGLAGEPLIVSTQIPPATAVVDQGLPTAPPDRTGGAAIFAARCTECHGVTGAGDGSRVQNGQIASVPDFLDPAVPGAQSVSAWFDTITNGRIDQLMPPWRAALSEQERWDVAYYTYTLHAGPEQIARGAEIFAGSCAGCHGETGRGDGPDAAGLSRPAGDLTDQARMVRLSDDALRATIAEGVGDPQTGMPAFAGQLSDDELRAVTSFVRTLGLRNAVPAAPGAASAPTAQAAATTPAAPTATTAPAATVISATPAGAVFTVSGMVVNGTAGGSVPDGLELSLFIFAQGADPVEIPGVSGAGGAFTFADVAFNADAAYAVTATYQDRLFLSDIATGQSLAANPALDVTIFELTDDPSVLTISLIETQINVAEGRLEVAQFIEVNNSSDRAFSTGETTADGRPISLEIPLPPGSVVPGFSTPGRYVFLPESFTVQDTQPVYPGRIDLVQLVYLIPYEGSAIIEQPLNYAFDGLDQLLVRPPGVTVTADGLNAMGTTALGGFDFMSFNATRTLPANSVLRVELSGNPAAAAASGTVSPNVALLLLVGGGILLGVLVALFVWTRRRAEAPASASPKATVDALARQIAELDAAHAAGEIPDDSYQKQRAGLKARLTHALLGEDHS